MNPKKQRRTGPDWISGNKTEQARFAPTVLGQSAVQALLLALAALELAFALGCASPSPGSRRRIDWTEQVRVSSGELILVERWTENIRAFIGLMYSSGGLFYAAGLKYKVPGDEGRFAIWDGPLSPLALDVVAGRTYLVAIVSGGLNPAMSRFRDQLMQAGYVAFELRDLEWIVIDPRDLPLEVKPNLLATTAGFFDGSERIDKPFITVERRIKINDSANNPEMFKNILRPPPRNSP